MIEAPRPNPEIIQGGMGAAVSDHRLARSVAVAGEKHDIPVLGIVSGTGLPGVMVRRLHNGDHATLRGLKEFDNLLGLKIGEKITEKYGIGCRLLSPKPEFLVTGHERKRNEMTNLAVASAFVEVWLAKQGHSGPIGINLLEKIQLMHLPTLLGAMLAGVDYVMVGAGVPNQIPKVLDNFSNGTIASYLLDVEGTKEKYKMTLDPKSFTGGRKLEKPKFFPVVSHHVLAEWLDKTVEVNGFIIEGPLAGGHNAPARGKEIASDGQPIYGEKDKPNLEKIAKLNKLFYLAGGYASPEKLAEAKKLGAAGIQAGSVFALCDQSGLREDFKEILKEKIASGKSKVITSRVSPSGFPFQVFQQEGTLSDKKVLEETPRVCDLGYLVHAYQRPDGRIGFRCPAEPIDKYVRKGGEKEDTEGKVCICKGLISAAEGLGVPGEPPIITLGKDLEPVKRLMKNKDGTYSAEEVVLFISSR